MSLPLSRGIGCALLWVVSWIAVPCWASDPGAPPSAPLTPEAAVAAALQTHTAVLQAEAALDRSRGAASEAALLLGNPELAIAASFDRSRAGAELGLPLSLSGAGLHERAATRAALDAAEVALARTRLEAAAEARRTYAAAVVAAGQVRVAQERVSLAAHLGQAVVRLHEEGEASALDLRIARLAEVQAAADLLQAREAEAAMLQALAAATGRPVTSADLVSDALSAAPAATGRGPQERADVSAAGERLRAAEAQHRAQRAAALPPLTVGVFAEVEDGQVFVGPAVAWELPVFRRNRAAQAGAAGQVAVAGGQLASVRARAATEQATAAHRVAEAESLTAALIEDPVDQARAALASIEVGYLAGEIDLPSAVLLQAEVLDGESAAISLSGRIAVARIDLLLATEDPSLLGGAP